MRFVSVKSVDQQVMLAWHRMRQGWSEERTTMINRIRGLLGEFGIWLPRPSEAFKRAVRIALEAEALPARMRALLMSALEQLASLEQYIMGCELEIKAHVKQSPEAQRVSALMGIGPITMQSDTRCSQMLVERERPAAPLPYTRS